MKVAIWWYREGKVSPQAFCILRRSPKIASAKLVWTPGYESVDGNRQAHASKVQTSDTLCKIVRDFVGTDDEIIRTLKHRYIGKKVPAADPDYYAWPNPELDMPLAEKESGKILAEWKHAEIKLIPKPGNVPCLDNFRPVSITFGLGKLLEHLVINWLHPFLQDSGGFFNAVSGFLSLLSTPDVMLHFKKHILDRIFRTTKQAALSLDIKGAFELVSHTLVLENLASTGCGTRMCHYERELRNKRRAAIGVKSIRTGTTPVPSEAPPTIVVLSNTLFNLCDAQAASPTGTNFPDQRETTQLPLALPDKIQVAPLPQNTIPSLHPGRKTAGAKGLQWTCGNRDDVLYTDAAFCIGQAAVMSDFDSVVMASVSIIQPVEAHEVKIDLTIVSPTKTDHVTTLCSSQAAIRRSKPARSVGVRESEFSGELEEAEEVYAIPLSCGATYIGQTRRCLNDRLQEHQMDAERAASQHPIVIHWRKCPGCAPNFTGTKAMGGHCERAGRQITEAYRMATSPQNISTPSISLSRKEIIFLTPTMEAER
ncbi:hypothetical protein ISCGN_013087 [Ixodes scapularis]